MLTVINDQIECPENLQSAPGHVVCRRRLANNSNLFGRSHLNTRYCYVYSKDVSDAIFFQLKHNYKNIKLI